MILGGSCVCKRGANELIQNVFGDCIYTNYELLAFYIGLSSILCWIVAQVPQLISNYRNKSAEALSPWFLAQWLSGDVFNFLGCLLTGDQLVTETITAFYFILCDCVIISQSGYYTWGNKKRALEEGQRSGSSSRDQINAFNSSSIQGSGSFAKQQAADLTEPCRQGSGSLTKKQVPDLRLSSRQGSGSLTNKQVCDLKELSRQGSGSFTKEHVRHFKVPSRQGSGPFKNKQVLDLKVPSMETSWEITEYKQPCQEAFSESQMRVPSQGSGSFAYSDINDFQEPSQEAFLKFQKRLAKITIVIPDQGKGEEFDHDEQHTDRSESIVFGRSGASMISSAVTSPVTPHSPWVEHGKKSPEISSLATTSGERSKVGNLEGVHVMLLSVRSEDSGEAFEDQTERVAVQFRNREERNICLEERRRSAARLGSIPEIDVERLFPTRNEMKRHLRKLVNHYDLDCGPPSLSRLTIHHLDSAYKHFPGRQSRGLITETSRQRFRLPQRQGKIGICIAGFAVGTATGFVAGTVTYFSRTPETSQGLAIFLRRVLAAWAHPVLQMSFDNATAPNLPQACGEGNRAWLTKYVGDGFGWGSSVLYLGSRFSQMSRNYQRRSSEGLSALMVTFAILANTFMGLSILMRAKKIEDLTSKAPWILGSMGTVVLDVLLLVQARYLNSRQSPSHKDPDETTSLVV